jgi:dihydroorotase
MDLLIRNSFIYNGGAFSEGDILVCGGRVADIAPRIPEVPGTRIFDSKNSIVFPGFADVHVHLREPGFSYKETIRTGTLAAAHGGYTAVCAMPNVDPPPDCLAGLSVQLGLIRVSAAVRVLPYGTITRNRAGKALSDMAALAPFVAGYSDDGNGVQDTGLMREAMLNAKALGKLIAAHCEDARAPAAESEWRELARDLDLVRETGCAYHACHISKKESVALIRRAKAEGLDVSCETAPHYLLLDDTMLRDDGRFKMNPPIGSAEDRAALVEALRDGTIDMIATDHAPHSAAEKSGGFAKSANGVVGLECAFAALYTGLAEPGIIPLARLVEAMSAAPAKRFGLGGGEIKPGAPADLTVFDLETPYTIDPGAFLSMGKATPFAGSRVKGRCLLTLANGETVWEEKKEEYENA